MMSPGGTSMTPDSLAPGILTGQMKPAGVWSPGLFSDSLHAQAQAVADGYWAESSHPGFVWVAQEAAQAARLLARSVARLYDPTPIDPEWLFARCDDFGEWERQFGAARVWFGRKRDGLPVGPA